MMNFMTQLSMMAAQSAETTEQRVERLEDLADQEDVDEEVLFDVEEDLRSLVKLRIEDLEGEQRERFQQLKENAPAILGVEPDQVEDVVAVMVARMIVSKPRMLPRFVHALDEIYLQNGLYQDIGGVEAPSAGELNRPIDIDVDDVDDLGADPTGGTTQSGGVFEQGGDEP